jgi:hypothetical protein
MVPRVNRVMPQLLTSAHISRLKSNIPFLKEFPEFGSAVKLMQTPLKRGCANCAVERDKVFDRMIRNGLRLMSLDDAERIKLFLGIRGPLTLTYLSLGSRGTTVTRVI